MKKNSISFKFFIINSVLLLILLTIIIVFQAIFFQNFYYDEKKSRLINSVEEFKNQYVNISDLDTLTKEIYKFEDNNNAKIVIIGENGIIKSTNDSINSIPKDKSNQVIYLALNHWLKEEQNYFDVLFNNKTISFNFENPVLNTNNLVVVSPITINDYANDIVFVISTLQPVNEAFAIMKKYYIYIYIIVLILIAILSLIYSKMITIPLVKLNDSATKISNLDFTVKCDITSDDEIGNLARTLNFLSHNLDLTLTKLKKANEKLKDDIEKEKKLEELRKEFVAGVSHELKTPISLISGYAEGLIDGIVDKEDEDYYLNVIIDESKKMNSLVMDMLDLSQLESGYYKLNKTNFNLYDFIFSIVNLYSNGVKTKNFILNYSIQSKQILVYGDELRLNEVVTNLIDNAIKYTKNQNNIYINIFDKDNRILIEIENHGEPIDKEHLNFIWDKFYRIDKSRNKKSGGTGLGLSIVKNILELHKVEYGIQNSVIGVKAYFYVAKAHKQ